MKIAFVIYNGMTALDFIGMYDPITRLQTMGFMTETTWDICAFTEQVHDSNGLRFTPDKVGQALSHYDLVAIPGGFGSRKLINDDAFVAWIKTAAHCPLKISVCTGSLIWGGSGSSKR